MDSTYLKKSAPMDKNLFLDTFWWSLRCHQPYIILVKVSLSMVGNLDLVLHLFLFLFNIIAAKDR